MKITSIVFSTKVTDEIRQFIETSELFTFHFEIGNFTDKTVVEVFEIIVN